MNQEPLDEAARRDHEPEPMKMPRWVPVAIGLVLVAFAVLAVYTGVRYRDRSPLVEIARRTTGSRGDSAAPPGEPSAGASQVYPGESGETIPEANEPVTGNARAVVSGGGAGGVNSVLRLWARRGMVVRAVPADAEVYVNEVLVGMARQFDSEEEAYDFANPGSYTVRVSAPDHAERTFIVTAADEAQDEVARIDVQLQKQ